MLWAGGVIMVSLRSDNVVSLRCSIGMSWRCAIEVWYWNVYLRCTILLSWRYAIVVSLKCDTVVCLRCAIGLSWRCAIVVSLNFCYLADPSKARRCLKNTVVIYSLIKSVTLSTPTALRRRQAKTVWNGASSHKIVANVSDLINVIGYQSCINGLKVTSILLEVCHCD